MSTVIHPTELYGWQEYFRECLMYLVSMGVLYLASFIIGCVIFVALPRKHSGGLRRRIGYFGLFVGLFLVVSSLFNGMWSCLVFDHLYYSTDYVSDFTPFCPVTMTALNPQVVNIYGQPFGTTLAELDAVWFAFAVGTWAVTIFLYRLIRRRLPPNIRTG